MLTNEQKILIEKTLKVTGLLAIACSVLIALGVLFQFVAHDLQTALWESEELLFNEGGLLPVGVAAACFWLKAFLRAGRQGA